MRVGESPSFTDESADGAVGGGQAEGEMLIPREGRWGGAGTKVRCGSGQAAKGKDTHREGFDPHLSRLMLCQLSYPARARAGFRMGRGPTPQGGREGPSEDSTSSCMSAAADV